MKDKADKKVNKIVRTINKQLAADVFKDRFWIRQAKKSRENDIKYYMFELRDRKQPFRNTLIRGWFSEFSFLYFDLSKEVNNFIVTSDFWEDYRSE